MGKLTAALIILFTVVWLGPMCARLPADLTAVSAPPAPAAPVAAIEPAVSTAPAIVPAAAPQPVAAPARPATERPALTVATYRSRKMFPVEKDKYIVSVLRANKSDVPAIGVVMTLSSKIKGNIVERAESGPGQTLAAGTTSYFGLTVSTVVFDEILDSDEAPGNELEWSVVYRFQDDAAGTKRCFHLRALPRRRQPEGILWRPLGESRACAK